MIVLCWNGCLYLNVFININDLEELVGKFYIMVKEYLCFVFFLSCDVLGFVIF